MAKPTPILRRGRWHLDLRAPWHLGQYTLRTPGLPELEAEAIHECYEIFARERAAAEVDAAQGSLFAGPALARVAEDWLGERDFARRGGERYVRSYVACIVERFGGRAVRQFEPPAGSATLKGWRDDMAAAGLAPKTRRNYLNVLMQILAYAADRNVIRAVPLKPRPTLTEETLASPDVAPYTEADFRALRAGLYDGREAWLARWIAPGDTVAAFVARRRLYCSWAFYTGMHVYDLDHLDDTAISPDFGSYWRSNHKSAATVPGAAFDCPEQLWIDVQAEIRRLGRSFRAGELICGGPWPEGARALAATARRLGLPPVNFRSTLRRSTAYEYALRGWSEREVADLLGHVDDRMVREVYRRVPLRLRSPVKIPWNRESTARLLGGRPWTGRAKVAPIRPDVVASLVQKERA